MSSKSSRIFCNTRRETSCHIFINFPFIKDIWSIVKTLVGLRVAIEHLQREWFCLIQYCREKKQASEVTKAFLNAMVYLIWRERNNKRFNNKIQKMEVIYTQLIRNIRNHLML